MKKKQPPQLSRAKYLKTKVRTLPIYKCYINSFWILTSLACVIVTRQHPNGNFALGVYFIDTYNKGLYNSNMTFNQTKEELEDFKEHMVSKNDKQFMLIEIDYGLAHNIIYGGYDFAKSKGYLADKFFEFSKYILEENNGTIEYIEINFGKNEHRDKIVKDNNGEDTYIKGIA